MWEGREAAILAVLADEGRLMNQYSAYITSLFLADVLCLTDNFLQFTFRENQRLHR
jgi:hypothetical protein